MKRIAAILVLVLSWSGTLQAGEELFTNVYAVPTTFLDNPPHIPGWRLIAETFENTRPVVKATAKSVLEAAGISFSEGASAIFNASTSQLIVRNTQTQMELVEAYVDSVRIQSEAQVYVTVREATFDDESPELTRLISEFFDFPEPSERINGNQRTKSFATREELLEELKNPPKVLEQPAKERQVREACQLTDPQFQLLIRALSQRKEVDLLAFPSVMARSGQGFISQLEERRIGAIAAFGANGDVIEAELFLPEVGKALFAIDAAEHEPTVRIRVRDGHTAVIAEQSTIGEKRLIFVNLRLLDPAGFPVKKSDEQEEEAVELPIRDTPESRRHPFSENPTERLLRETALPKVEFDGARMVVALEYLQQEILKHGKSETGLFPEAKPQFRVDVPGETLHTEITLRLINVPAIEALRYVTELANCKYEISGRTVRIFPAEEKAE